LDPPAERWLSNDVEREEDAGEVESEVVGEDGPVWVCERAGRGGVGMEAVRDGMVCWFL
jgi:hypothetical protein